MFWVDKRRSMLLKHNLLLLPDSLFELETRMSLARHSTDTVSKSLMIPPVNYSIIQGRFTRY